jgi:3-oxoacyl-[acyl-carrier-protein] synthase III
MMMMNAAPTSLAIALPERVVTNAFFREHYAEVVRTAEERVLGKLWRPSPDSKSARFDAAMAPYLNDPFRGVVERRWLAEGESALDLETRAAKKALALAGIDERGVDAIICSSFFPDQLDVGNASFLAQKLGVTCPAWNLESACSSSLVALQTASALVHAGAHRRVLCVTSCCYSRISPPEDTLSWGNGDGAAAFVVERTASERCGLLGFHSMSTNVTCGAITSTWQGDRLVMHTTEAAGRLLRETAEPFLRTCVDGALAKAGARIDDVDLLVCNTPTAWYTAFCADVLGVAPEKTVNVHARVANVGPVLLPANLAHAVDRIDEDALVLLYAVGSVSNASAAVVRWPRLRAVE